MKRSREPPPAGRKRYSVHGLITISVRTEVVASSPDEAREIAMNERGLMSLCCHCSSKDADAEWVTSGEFDCDAPSPADGETELEVVEL